MTEEILSGTSRDAGGGQTSEPFRRRKASGASTLSQLDSRAKTSPQRGGETESMANVADYFSRSFAWFDSCDLESCSWKTSQTCLLTGWEPYLESWPKSGLMRSGVCCRLPFSAPHIKGRGYSFWPTPMASDGRRLGISRQAHLKHWAKNWHGGYGSGPGAGNLVQATQIEFGYSPSPEFVEWLMGFPRGWTSGDAKHRIKAIGNAVVPQVAEWIGKLIVRGERE